MRQSLPDVPLWTAPDCTTLEDSMKWGRYAGQAVIPMWVADMDFAAPPPVLAALQARIAHGMLGYSRPWPALNQTLSRYCAQRYSWHIDPDWLVWLPGVVSGLYAACRMIPESAAALCAPPIYPPFLHIPAASGRRLLQVPLQREASGWRWDWAATEAALANNKGGLIMLCHPHNPVGRCWTEAELTQLLSLAQAHGYLVCSDEIHGDLILAEDRRHRPFATLNAAAAACSITLMAPSKTYNIPGLGCGWAIIPDAALRARFRRQLVGQPEPGLLGLVACEAALSAGAPWLESVLATLRANARRIAAWVADHPPLHSTTVEASYLAWIDARALAVENPQRHFERFGVGLSDGKDFGQPGYVRLNFACPPTRLEIALTRMREAVAAAG